MCDNNNVLERYQYEAGGTREMSFVGMPHTISPMVIS